MSDTIRTNLSTFYFPSSVCFSGTCRDADLPWLVDFDNTGAGFGGAAILQYDRGNFEAGVYVEVSKDTWRLALSFQDLHRYVIGCDRILKLVHRQPAASTEEADFVFRNAVKQETLDVNPSDYDVYAVLIPCEGGGGGGSTVTGTAPIIVGPDGAISIDPTALGTTELADQVTVTGTGVAGDEFKVANPLPEPGNPGQMLVIDPDTGEPKYVDPSSMVDGTSITGTGLPGDPLKITNPLPEPGTSGQVLTIDPVTGEPVYTDQVVEVADQVTITGVGTDADPFKVANALPAPGTSGQVLTIDPVTGKPVYTAPALTVLGTPTWDSVTGLFSITFKDETGTVHTETTTILPTAVNTDNQQLTGDTTGSVQLTLTPIVVGGVTNYTVKADLKTDGTTLVIDPVTHLASSTATGLIVQGTDITITGAGTTASPYVVNVNLTSLAAGLAGKVGKVVQGTNTTVTGTGTAADPYVVNAAADVTTTMTNVLTTGTKIATYTNEVGAAVDIYAPAGGGSPAVTCKGSHYEQVTLVAGVAKTITHTFGATNPLSIGYSVRGVDGGTVGDWPTGVRFINHTANSVDVIADGVGGVVDIALSNNECLASVVTSGTSTGGGSGTDTTAAVTSTDGSVGVTSSTTGNVTTYNLSAASNKGTAGAGGQAFLGNTVGQAANQTFGTAYTTVLLPNSVTNTFVNGTTYTAATGTMVIGETANYYVSYAVRFGATFSAAANTAYLAGISVNGVLISTMTADVEVAGTKGTLQVPNVSLVITLNAGDVVKLVAQTNDAAGNKPVYASRGTFLNIARLSGL